MTREGVRLADSKDKVEEMRKRRAKEQTVVRKQIALRLRPVLHTTGRTNIMANDSRCRVLLGLTGSVAVIKAPQLVVELSKFAEVKLLVTKSSEHFLQRSEQYNQRAFAAFKALDPPTQVLGDADEWEGWDAVGDHVLHIELRNWADIILIAPLSANTLAKLASGICDNLVTCVARAWNFRDPGKKFVVAPAMNTCMWEHPMTARHIGTLSDLGIIIIPPVSKTLACGDEGVGALAEVENICAEVRDMLDDLPRS